MKKQYILIEVSHDDCLKDNSKVMELPFFIS